MILVSHFSSWVKSSEGVIEIEYLEISKSYLVVANCGYFLFTLFLPFKPLGHKLKANGQRLNLGTETLNITTLQSCRGCS